MAATNHLADQTISSPLVGAGRFLSLESTPFWDSRCTFSFRNLAQDCLLESFPEFTQLDPQITLRRGFSINLKSINCHKNLQNLVNSAFYRHSFLHVGRTTNTRHSIDADYLFLLA